MATMNKPTYAAIQTHSPNKPVLVFVASRRQTRLTALDLIAFSAADGNPRKWLHMNEQELSNTLRQVQDPNLKHIISFGIAMHHAGLHPKDRDIVEHLYLNMKIQVLVCTATLAWGVNFPAHLVVVKGTEFYDAKVKRYVDFPITDVLQMIGRAGRPQFDTEAKAVVLVHEPKKNFYLNFLHSPFPVESSLLAQLHDHFNAEICSGTIHSMSDAIDYLTWTFLFRRLLINPSYYNLEENSPAGINLFLINQVKNTIKDLENAGLLHLDDYDHFLSTSLGKIASFYYLQYQSMITLTNRLNARNTLPELLDTLSSVAEFAELPVRHNEDKMNEGLAPKMKFPLDSQSYDSPHTKTNILLQAHFMRLELPISDYYTDLKSVLDQAIRILQAMVDISASSGWLSTTLLIMNLTQMIVQGRWLYDHQMRNLPHVTEKVMGVLWDADIQYLPQLLTSDPKQVQRLLQQCNLSAKHMQELQDIIAQLPIVVPQLSLSRLIQPAPTAPDQLASTSDADKSKIVPPVPIQTPPIYVDLDKQGSDIVSVFSSCMCMIVVVGSQRCHNYPAVYAIGCAFVSLLLNITISSLSVSFS